MPEEKPAHWYRQVLDAIADLVLVKGTSSRIVWANQAFAITTGCLGKSSSTSALVQTILDKHQESIASAAIEVSVRCEVDRVR